MKKYYFNAETKAIGKREGKECEMQLEKKLDTANIEAKRGENTV